MQTSICFSFTWDLAYHNAEKKSWLKLKLIESKVARPSDNIHLNPFILCYSRIDADMEKVRRRESFVSHAMIHLKLYTDYLWLSPIMKWFAAHSKKNRCVLVLVFLFPSPSYTSLCMQFFKWKASHVRRTPILWKN